MRDNLNETEPAKATGGGHLIVTTAANTLIDRDVVTDFIGTGESTASGAYTDLATVGPIIIGWTGPKVLVAVAAYMQNNASGGRAWMSHEIEVGEGILAGASDRWAAIYTSPVSNQAYEASEVALWTTLPAGLNTFRAKYRTSTVGTATFTHRRLIVMPL